MVEYTYWAVKCKTDNCGTILLDCIGLKIPYRHPIVPICENFELTCDGCKAHFTYSWRDLLDVTHTGPCIESTICIAFRDAVQKAKQSLDA